MPSDSTPHAADVPATVEPEPSAVIGTEDPDPETARVAGVAPGESYAAAYQWLDRQLRPAADRVDLTSHGGGLRRDGTLPADSAEELADGLATMAEAADHASPAGLLGEFAARSFTYGRAVAERSRRLDELAELLVRATRRLEDVDDRRDRAGVLVTLGDRLAATGQLLYDRYGEAVPRDDQTDQLAAELPVRPDPTSPRRIARLLAAYDRLYPSAPDGGTLAAVPTAAVEELHEAREQLALAVCTVSYARWDGADDCWPLSVSYPVEFARPSPAAELQSLAEYEPHGLRVDARAFDDRLADRITRLRDGRYLTRFRRVGWLYVRSVARLAGEPVPAADSLGELVDRIRLPERLDE